jgi:hypothetical protein
MSPGEACTYDSCVLISTAFFEDLLRTEDDFKIWQREKEKLHEGGHVAKMKPFQNIKAVDSHVTR